MSGELVYEITCQFVNVHKSFGIIGLRSVENELDIHDWLLIHTGFDRKAGVNQYRDLQKPVFPGTQRLNFSREILSHGVPRGRSPLNKRLSAVRGGFARLSLMMIF